MDFRVAPCECVRVATYLNEEKVPAILGTYISRSHGGLIPQT